MAITFHPICARRSSRRACSYVRNGSALVVLLDPYRRRVDRWLDGDHAVLGTVAQLDCAPVMPGFVLDVSSILEA